MDVEKDATSKSEASENIEEKPDRQKVIIYNNNYPY